MDVATSEDLVQTARALLDADRLTTILNPQLAARVARGRLLTLMLHLDQHYKSALVSSKPFPILPDTAE